METKPRLVSKVSPAWPPQQKGGLALAPRRVPEGAVSRRCGPNRQPPPPGSDAELRSLPVLPACAEMRATVPERSYASGSFDFAGKLFQLSFLLLISLPPGTRLLELSP